MFTRGQLRVQKWWGFGGKGDGAVPFELGKERDARSDTAVGGGVALEVRRAELDLHRDHLGCGSFQLISSMNHSFSTAEPAWE